MYIKCILVLYSMMVRIFLEMRSFVCSIWWCTDVEESLLTPHLLSFKEEPHNISLGHSGWCEILERKNFFLVLVCTIFPNLSVRNLIVTHL